MPRHNSWHYRAGEMVVALELPDDPSQHAQSHARVLAAIEKHLAGSIGGVFRQPQRRPEPLVFNAPGRPPLAFLFYDLEQSEPAATKKVIQYTHRDDVAAVRGSGLSPVGVMPHWLGSAQQDYTDGSPASLPRPAEPKPPPDGRYRYRYTPRERGLNFRARSARRPPAAAVPVLILDTRPDLGRAQRQAARFEAVNGQLGELLGSLSNPTLPGWHTTALDERDRDALKLARTPDGRNRRHDISDHALFIAGLIHDLAPRAAIELRPVLNRFGVGDLHLLLQVLKSVLDHKSAADPLVLNMSLGFLPKLEHMMWVWYGIDRPNDPDFVGDVQIQDDPPRDANWLASNRGEVDRTHRLLHSGVERLAEYLLASNCLAVAAAGNDSLQRVEHGRPRLGPRIPARYATVLGVAATTLDPSTGAAYSNAGDDLEYGDHVAMFGGDVTPSDEPKDGVIGVYSARSFPAARGGRALANENGWASWSGTSFSTAIVSGLAAGYWTLQRDRSAQEVLGSFSSLAADYAPALCTRSIEIRGEWTKI